MKSKMRTVFILVLVGAIAGCGESQSRKVINAIEQKVAEKAAEQKGAEKANDENAIVTAPEDADKLLEQGARYIEKGMVSNGVEKLEQAVALGNVKAMLALAMLYQDGKAIEPDSKKSFELLKEAAQRDCPEAMALLAACYKNGCGVASDEEKARYWLLKAAEAEYAPVLLLLARDKYWAARFDAVGNAKSVKARTCIREAIPLLEKIKEDATEEFVEANILLGNIYMDGVGIEANPELGKSHYEKCIERNSALAMQKLGKAYCEGTNLKRDYDKGIELIRKSQQLLKDDCETCEALGRAYLDPEWNGFNRNEGIECLENAVKLADRDYPIRDTLYRLGMIYAFENRELSRFNRGVEFLKRASEEGIGDASYYLAVLYFNGDGVEKDMYMSSNYAEEAERSLHVTQKIQDAARRLRLAIKTIRRY